jgi:hypothetical protein
VSKGRRATARLALALMFYAVAGALALDVISSALGASRGYAALTAYQTPEEKTDTLVRGWLDRLSFGVYEGARDKAESIEQVARAAEALARQARDRAWVLLGLSLAFLAWSARAARGARPPTALIVHLLGVAGVFLAVGLGAPILTVSALGEVAVLGEVVLQHETKGVLSTIEALADTGNHVVALLLAAFSVVVPALKLLMSLLVLLVRHQGLRRFTLRAIDVIGKWSMTDVFVVAILLAFLAAETEQLTDASVGPGLYFFAGYGILSMIAGHLMVRHEAALVTPG